MRRITRARLADQDLRIAHRDYGGAVLGNVHARCKDVLKKSNARFGPFDEQTRRDARPSVRNPILHTAPPFCAPDIPRAGRRRDETCGMVKDVAFIAYAVRDVPKALAFYRDVVGLQPGKAFNEGFVEFDVGSTAFALDGEPPPGSEAGKCSGLAFEVDDIARARGRLLEGGADVTDVYEFPHCSVCFAKDPDGNAFALHQRKA